MSFLRRLTLSIYNGVICGHVNRLNHVQCVFARPSPIRSLTHSLPPLPTLHGCSLSLSRSSLSHCHAYSSSPFMPLPPSTLCTSLCTLKGREEEQGGCCYSHLASSRLSYVHRSATRCNQLRNIHTFESFFFASSRRRRQHPTGFG